MRSVWNAHYAFLIKFVLLGRHRELCSQVYLNHICDVQEISMTDLKLPSAMAELRPALVGIITEGYEQAPYFSVLLSSKQGLQIRVDNREERVT